MIEKIESKKRRFRNGQRIYQNLTALRLKIELGIDIILKSGKFESTCKFPKVVQR